MPPKSKDPNKPRGRKSAYAFFLQERKDQKDSKESFTEFSKRSAELWHDLKDHEKAKYYDMQADDKKRYDKEMAKYVPPKEEKGGRRKRRKQKDKDAPKRAMSGFMHFCAAKRPTLRKLEKNEHATVAEIAKQLGSLWKMMTDEQKKPYEELAAKDRTRYDKDMQAYRERQKQLAAAAEDEEEEEEEEDDDDESSD